MKSIPFRVVRTCPHCQSVNVRRSRRKGFFERFLLPLLLVRPYRCQKCDLRHYNFIFSRRDTEGAA